MDLCLKLVEMGADATARDDVSALAYYQVWYVLSDFFIAYAFTPVL